MKILAVDTSTSAGSVAIVDGSRVLAECSLESARTHNRRLLKAVDDLLNHLGWSLDDLGGLAVTLGPGSFTGIRIGISTMKTLAWALDKPYVGIPTLDALAAPLHFASAPVCALLDARKKEVYAAFYQPDGRGACRRISPYQVLQPQRLLARIQNPTLFCGDGWLQYGSILRRELGDLVMELPGPYHLVRASFVAELARQRFTQGLGDDPMTSVPIYVRPSEAEILGAAPAA
ncbi:MAG TPA: tRNA (adenosine(37)-N6)-threonylcarbamoyltransferase complex dimerization subunit type 1 TsaB [Syntrophobacteraceae bacterium]|jgi:tRNA threonylcarbamoyladenosine biosynthesis protein TsaB|nr:tRNA (adenosine(37)-N6)-threonylcarbamoyltransferase complex dimerization subunit type 1 TsaB [Syntrophobacteraceae bacterium]